nr:hypothetical protein LKV13_04810 [Borrelia sp. BU AG58]
MRFYSKLNSNVSDATGCGIITPSVAGLVGLSTTPVASENASAII